MTPEAVAQAMKVLEIHERLENTSHALHDDEPGDGLGENEVEVLKEMCNVSLSCHLGVHFKKQHGHTCL